MLTVTALILSPKDASCSLNFLVWVWQTGVSSDGTTLMMVGLPFRSAGVVFFRPPASNECSVQDGAGWPTLTGSPTRVSGLPLNVTARGRDMGGPFVRRDSV